MNKDLEEYARAKLKENLSKCTEEERRIFKLMYSPGNPEANIDIVVDNMDTKNLDWAMQQVQRTLDKRKG